MKRYLDATFLSLTNQNFRLYFAGQSISQIGTWTQKIAQAWLVLELTNSGTLLGVTLALQALPTLVFTPWGGLLADRWDKRRFMLWTQGASTLPAIFLGVLSATGNVTLLTVLITAAVLGTVEAFDKPARQTFIAELVPRDQLTNALTLNNITINAGKLVGPAIAGILITNAGLAMSFFVNAASFCVVLAALLLIRPGHLAPNGYAGRAKGQLRDGIRYVRGRPLLFGPLVLLTVTGLLAWEWTVTLPLLARDAFNGDAQSVSSMFIAMGSGAVIGVLVLGGALRATTGQLMITNLTFAVLLLVTAATPVIQAAWVSLFLLGAAGVAYRVITSTLAQLESDPTMRGRTMSLFVIALGGTSPVSAPLLGWLCEAIGVRATLAVGGIGTAAASLGIWMYLRNIKMAAADTPAKTLDKARPR